MKSLATLLHEGRPALRPATAADIRGLVEGHRERVRVDIDAVYYFANEADVDGTPGWYLEDGQRRPFSGPWADLAEARDAAALFAGRQMPPMDTSDAVALAIRQRAQGPDLARDALVFPMVTFTKAERITIGSRSRVDDYVKLEGGKGLDIGARVHVASFCHLNIGGGRTILKDGSATGSGSRIVSGGNSPHAVSASRAAVDEDQVLYDGVVVLEENAALYVGVTVVCNPRRKATLTIGRGARVGANSLVLDDVPPYEIWVGSPARFAGYVETEEARAWLLEHNRDFRALLETHVAAAIQARPPAPATCAVCRLPESHLMHARDGHAPAAAAVAEYGPDAHPFVPRQTS